MSYERPQQQAARVNVTDEEWLHFRTLVLRQRSSIAARLGELVRSDLERATSSTGTVREARRAPTKRIRLDQAKKVTDNPKWRTR